MIQGSAGAWEVIIGLEVHAQVISKAKLFSGAATAFGAAPNSQVSFVDMAMPGMLPVINKYCVEQAVRTGLGLKARINKHSVFDRKNYFYPDLPAGYQISQYKQPIVGEGEVLVDLPDGKARRVGIERLHLEQDAGKSLHDQRPDASFVDLNRAGIALMEIVTKPDLRSAEEAGAFIRKLRSILRYLGTCDGNMEEGSLRCDVNVSVRKRGAPLSTRCEVKNVNSVRFVMRAIEYEARRQVEILESGGSIEQETRLFDAGKGETRSMRSKEEAHDYRYFPDPDLLPLELDEEWIERIRASLPELPDERTTRFMHRYGLSAYDASVLVADKEVADYFEQAVKETLRGKYGDRVNIGSEDTPMTVALDELIENPDVTIQNLQLVTEVKTCAKSCSNWITGDLFGHLNEANLGITESAITPRHIGRLVQLISDGTISGRIAKEVFEVMFETAEDPATIIEQKGLKQVSDSGAIEAAIETVLSEQAEKLAEYRSGKDKLFGFFVGQVMKATGGKANPQVLNELLKKKLAG